eukprot:TRINITY_DN1343_c0_g3_i1.p1 TRINITY_DN1343_c0_g3~~TRINITY_DN1343_c0_g3_i1.p1  ORF type:complete len:234 (+),score=103.44 TRINITY_DN1343_c0_g3_i1:120-821(+)
MSEDNFDWINFFEENEIIMKEVPFGLPPVDKSTDKTIETSLATFKCDFSYPKEYTAFAKQIGAGTLGRCRIFTPGTNINSSDLRFHTLRLLNKFKNEDYKIIHKFPLDHLIVFGHDVKEDLWFAWRHSAKDPHAIYVFQEEDNSPPPMEIAEDFMEFIEEVALGTAMQDQGMKKLREPRYNPINGMEEEEEESDEEYLPPQKFVPLPNGPRGMMSISLPKPQNNNDNNESEQD